VVQNADSANNLADDACLLQAVNVRGVADNEGSAGGFLAATNTDGATGLEKNLVHRGVKHVSAAVDGAETREGLGEATKTVDGVEEGRVTVLAHRLHVELHLAGSLDGWLLQVRVLDVQGNSVAQEIDGLSLKTEAGVKILHGHRVEVLALPGVGVFEVDSVHVLVEAAALLLLEETHEAGLDGLRLVGGHLVDGVFSAAKHAA